MKIVCVFIVAIFLSLPLSAQKSKDKLVSNDLKRLTEQLTLLRESNKELQKTVSSQKEQIEQLNKQLTDVKASVVNVSNSVDRSFAAASLENEKISDRVGAIGNSINLNILIFTLCCLALALFGFGGFSYLRKRITTLLKPAVDDVGDGKLSSIAARLADSNKRDSEFLDLLKTAFSLSPEKSKTGGSDPDSVDHKLPLKVGDEIHRMRKRIENMPQEIKGLGALRNSLTRLEEEFNDSGYKIEDLIGKQYDDGMRLEARFVDDPNVPIGKEIITDVIRPQIMHNDKVIQFAKVEVGKSY